MLNSFSKLQQTEGRGLLDSGTTDNKHLASPFDDSIVHRFGSVWQ